MKTQTNTNENGKEKTIYIVYQYNEITNDIQNVYESMYPLELVQKYGLNEKHFNDYILKDNENWESSERRFNNMFIIKDSE